MLFELHLSTEISNHHYLIKKEHTCFWYRRKSGENKKTFRNKYRNALGVLDEVQTRGKFF